MKLLQFKIKFINATKYILSVGKNNQYNVNSHMSSVFSVLTCLEDNQYERINLFVRNTGAWSHTIQDDVLCINVSYNPIEFFKSNYIIAPTVCIKPIVVQFINMLETNFTVNKKCLVNV